MVFGQCQGVSMNTLTLADTQVYYSNAVEVCEGLKFHKNENAILTLLTLQERTNVCYF